MTLRSMSHCLALGLVPGAMLLAFSGEARAHGGPSNACKDSAVQLVKACRLDAEEEARIDRVDCINLSDRRARDACFGELGETYGDALDECRDQRDARLEVCEEVGPGPYDPRIDPRNFVERITNPFAPFSPGSRWVYEAETSDGLERDVVEVLEETREILGVACTQVHDRVFEDGELVEDTIDWLAQDRAGNLWYFGELSKSFEDGLLRSLDGSFEAGVDGAKPGIWVEAHPAVGDFYRQEWAPGEAEDVVEVLDLDADVDAPYADRGDVLQTRDFTPLEPGAVEYKFYVPGIGVVLELDPANGERLELVEYSIE